MSQDGSSELAKALAELQANLPNVGADKKVDVVKDGRKQYDYRYAPLHIVHGEILPAMAKVGLAWFTIPDMFDGKFGLRTELMHISGESRNGFFPFPPQSSAQQIGSIITYARRYSILCATGLMPDEDDDGAAASRPEPTRPTAQTQNDDPTVARKLLDDALKEMTVAQIEWAKARAREMGMAENLTDATSAQIMALVKEIDKVKAERAAQRKRDEASEKRTERINLKPDKLLNQLGQLGPQPINRYNMSAGTALEKEGKVTRREGDPICWILKDGTGE